MSKEVQYTVLGAVVVAALAGYLAWQGGYSGGYSNGYAKAVADTKATQQELAKKATDEAAKAANPFQATNPLEGVTVNPFEKAAQKLNPFSE